MLNQLMCRVSQHKVDRHKVWNDGIDFRTACGRCGKPLVRDPGGWRVFSPELDDNPMRNSHPRDRGG